eukprot:15087918-Alexandrium_andersonii.AAC.1
MDIHSVVAGHEVQAYSAQTVVRVVHAVLPPPRVPGVAWAVASRACPCHVPSCHGQHYARAASPEEGPARRACWQAR